MHPVCTEELQTILMTAVSLSFGKACKLTRGAHVANWQWQLIVRAVKLANPERSREQQQNRHQKSTCSRAQRKRNT